MSEKTRKQDRRTRYTRQTIKDTFLELLKQKSFTKITVTEVCKNAEINRGTFYLHYYDIHDVLSDIFNDMTQDMLTTVDHLFCLNQKSCSYPFCQKIQMESQYRALFLDDAIAPHSSGKISRKYKSRRYNCLFCKKIWNNKYRYKRSKKNNINKIWNVNKRI